MKERTSMRAALVLSAPQMFGFMKGQVSRLRRLGYQVDVVASPGFGIAGKVQSEGGVFVPWVVKRGLGLADDTKAFFQLVRIMHLRGYSAALLSGPKAIFLGSLAASLVGIDNRVAVYHGLRQDAMVGGLAMVLDTCDRISSRLCTSVLCVSPSLRGVLIQRGIVEAHKVSVTGPGTANGVDAGTLDLGEVERRSADLARGLRLDKSRTKVFGFVGRLTEDKGLAQLSEIGNLVRSAVPSAVFLAVGQEEPTTLAGRQQLDVLKASPGAIFLGYQEDAYPALALLDVLVLPSRREGFGMVIAEAGLLGVPCVAYDVTGVRDAIEDGVSGSLVPFGDINRFAAALVDYLRDDPKRRRHGDGARERFSTGYPPKEVWAAYARAVSFY